MSDEIKPDIIFTTGGTGFSVRDKVPEETLRTAERNAHVIAEAIRMHSLKTTPNAMLSRAESVIRGRTLIISSRKSESSKGVSGIHSARNKTWHRIA